MSLQCVKGLHAQSRDTACLILAVGCDLGLPQLSQSANEFSVQIAVELDQNNYNMLPMLMKQNVLSASIFCSKLIAHLVKLHVSSSIAQRL